MPIRILNLKNHSLSAFWWSLPTCIVCSFVIAVWLVIVPDLHVQINNLLERVKSSKPWVRSLHRLHYLSHCPAFWVILVTRNRFGRQFSSYIFNRLGRNSLCLSIQWLRRQMSTLSHPSLKDSHRLVTFFVVYSLWEVKFRGSHLLEAEEVEVPFSPFFSSSCCWDFLGSLEQGIHKQAITLTSTTCFPLNYYM